MKIPIQTVRERQCEQPWYNLLTKELQYLMDAYPCGSKWIGKDGTECYILGHQPPDSVAILIAEGSTAHVLPGVDPKCLTPTDDGLCHIDMVYNVTKEIRKMGIGGFYEESAGWSSR